MNTQIHEEAATWLVELRTGDNEPATRKEFDNWIRKSPEHLRAYLELTEIWQDAAEIQDTQELSRGQLVASARTDDNIVSLRDKLKVESAKTETPSPSRFSILTFHFSLFTLNTPLKFVASIILAVALTASAWYWLAYQQGVYSTDIGEQRLVRLEDGSTMELNSRSSVRVRFSEHQRNIELIEGQALFRVTKDKERPFIVATDRTQVRAVGTQFDVYRKNSGTTVTVLEGRVTVQTVQPQPYEPRAQRAQTTQASGLGPQALLVAGEQLTVPTLTPEDIGVQLPLLAQKADIETATAWTQQRLVFKSSPLTAVAEEFNRYNPRRIVITDPALADFLISGVYSSTDPALLIQFLREQPGIAIDDSGDQIIVRGAREP